MKQVLYIGVKNTSEFVQHEHSKDKLSTFNNAHNLYMYHPYRQTCYP